MKDYSVRDSNDVYLADPSPVGLSHQELADKSQITAHERAESLLVRSTSVSRLKGFQLAVHR